MALVQLIAFLPCYVVALLLFLKRGLGIEE